MTSNDGPQETPAEARARRRAELPPTGTVQEEAALLVDLLSERGWGTPSGMPSGGAGERARSRGRTSGGTTGERPSSEGEQGAPASGTGSSRSRAGAEHECTCGGRRPAACAVCPVCQLIAFVQQVNPETIDKVADFVGFAATALRDLATAQRERRAGTDEGPEGGPEGAPDGGPDSDHGSGTDTGTDRGLDSDLDGDLDGEAAREEHAADRREPEDGSPR